MGLLSASMNPRLSGLVVLSLLPDLCFRLSAFGQSGEDIMLLNLVFAVVSMALLKEEEFNNALSTRRIG